MVEAVEPQGSIALATGYNADDPDEIVEFAGDWRMMRNIAEALEEGWESVPAEIEEWQITRRYARDHN